MLLDSRLDLALVEGEIHSPDLLVRPVIRDELVLVCPPDHPFARRAGILAEELEGQPFILREEGSGTRARLEEFLKSRDIAIVPKWICYGADPILAAVEGGQGLSVISRRLVECRRRRAARHCAGAGRRPREGLQPCLPQGQIPIRAAAPASGNR